MPDGVWRQPIHQQALSFLSPTYTSDTSPFWPSLPPLQQSLPLSFLSTYSPLGSQKTLSNHEPDHITSWLKIINNFPIIVQLKNPPLPPTLYHWSLAALLPLSSSDKLSSFQAQGGHSPFSLERPLFRDRAFFSHISAHTSSSQRAFLHHKSRSPHPHSYHSLISPQHLTIL